VGEVAGDFFWGHVHVGKDDKARAGLLQNLRAPTGFDARVKPLAAMEAEHFQTFDEQVETGTTRAISVMIVVGPTEAEFLLAFKLDLRGLVALLPILAFPIEKQIAGALDS
jgi:hypothetical protein